MIQTHLLSLQIQWMTFMKKLMTTTQAGKKIIVFDDMIADIMSHNQRIVY